MPRTGESRGGRPARAGRLTAGNAPPGTSSAGCQDAVDVVRTIRLEAGKRTHRGQQPADPVVALVDEKTLHLEVRRPDAGPGTRQPSSCSGSAGASRSPVHRASPSVGAGSTVRERCVPRARLPAACRPRRNGQNRCAAEVVIAVRAVIKRAETDVDLAAGREPLANDPQHAVNVDDVLERVLRDNVIEAPIAERGQRLVGEREGLREARIAFPSQSGARTRCPRSVCPRLRRDQHLVPQCQCRGCRGRN